MARPRCGTPIRGRHNVPVLGWLLLRGRCWDCGTPISVRYPLVEAATGVCSPHGLRSRTVPAPSRRVPGLAALAVALALIDLDIHRLPDALVLPAYPSSRAAGAGLRRYGLASGRSRSGGPVRFYFALAIDPPGSMGLGDVKPPASWAG